MGVFWCYARPDICLGMDFMFRLTLTVLVKPTKAKESLYLLIPKDIAELMDINNKTHFTLTVQNGDKGKRLEYNVKNHNRRKH